MITVSLLAMSVDSAATNNLIVAAGDHDFPPYEFVDDQGNPAGLNVDLLQTLADEMGFDVRFQLGPWDIGRQAITTGEIDVLPMYVADFRAPEIAFASPHVIIYHEIFIRQGTPILRGVDDLVGLEVIVQKDAWVQELLEEMVLEAKLILVESERDALQLLASGRHDAALVSEVVGRRIMREQALGDLTTSGPALFPVEYALAVRSDNPDLLATINEGLERIKASGQFNRLHERWLGQSPAVMPSETSWTPWLVLLAALILSLLLLVARWPQRRNARSVAEETMIIEQRYLQDALTGLPNRIGLEQHLEKQLTGDWESDHALIYLDLDQFKLVNASSDYQIGDEVLTQTAEFLQKTMDPKSFLARPGGDEFCILIHPVDETSALAAAESIRTKLEHKEFISGDEPVRVTASLGIAMVDEHMASIGELLKHAEAACHAAKEAGRNRVHLYHVDDEALAQRHGQMRWVREVGLALKEDRLALYYQTIEPARPDEKSGLTIELLLRLHMPDGQLVSAGEFVPAAEKYFIAHRIDRWVIRTALHWLEKHRRELPNLERVYINISARSLGDDRFLPFVLEQFQQHDVPPGIIGFELTETAMMTHLNTGLKTIGRLRTMGCKFALDDFGVGVSSMSYLKQLPIDVLKIDGSFTRAAASNDSERALLAEINGLGHVLGKITVVEQVETDAMRQIMIDIGIDRVQGWAISKPRPLDDLLDQSKQTH